MTTIYAIRNQWQLLQRLLLGMWYVRNMSLRCMKCPSHSTSWEDYQSRDLGTNTICLRLLGLDQWAIILPYVLPPLPLFSSTPIVMALCMAFLSNRSKKPTLPLPNLTSDALSNSRCSSYMDTAEFYTAGLLYLASWGGDHLLIMRPMMWPKSLN